MARRLIRRYLPRLEWVRTHKRLRFLGERLHEPNLWHLNRASVAKAAAVGLFIAFIPVPFQMGSAALAALFFGANLPIAVALVWISNPLTMPAMVYFCYQVGAVLLHTPARELAFEMSFAWWSTELLRVWQPLLLGCLLVAIAASGSAYYVVRGLWRQHVLRDWERRRVRKSARPARPRVRET